MRSSIRAALGPLLLAAALAGCGAYVPPDTARMPMTPQGVPALTENDAIVAVEYDLAQPGSLRGDPARAARAVAAADWLAGQDGLNGDYGSYAPMNRLAWQAVRREARAAIGVAPGTPSQTVVDRLFAAASSLKAGDHAAAAAQLQPPAFTLGGEQTLAVLANLPPLPSLPMASADLQSHLHRQPRCRLPLAC